MHDVLVLALALLSVHFASSAWPFPNAMISKFSSISQWEIKDRMIGEYNNYEQFSSDCTDGRENNCGDGHEFVSATFMQLPGSPNILVAKYYYGTNKSDVFRFRYYEFYEHESNHAWMRILPFSCFIPQSIFMRIYRPSRLCEARLKANCYNEKVLPTISDFELLKGCVIAWKKTSRGFWKGKLVGGLCEVASQQNPGVILLVNDELKLWKDELWINDRVFTQSGELLIGNKDGIPYKLKRSKKMRGLNENG